MRRNGRKKTTGRRTTPRRKDCPSKPHHTDIYRYSPTEVLFFGCISNLIRFQAHQTAPIGNFYHRSEGPNSFSEESLYWQPGAPLPVGRMSTPTRQHPPLYPTVEQSQSHMESDDSPMQATLNAILASQAMMQKQMAEILNRVDKLESSMKDTSLSSSFSSADEVKRKRRLPSELCVSVCSYLLII